MPNSTVYDPESVMHVDLGGNSVNFSSAGGFSNYFKRPAYQHDAVDLYLHSANLSYTYYRELNVDFNKTRGVYCRSGRAYPDVSANGANFRAYAGGGHNYHFFGSSLASPLFASVLTLVSFNIIVLVT